MHSENKHSFSIGRCSSERFPKMIFSVWVVNRNVYSNLLKNVRLRNVQRKNNVKIVLNAVNIRVLYWPSIKRSM